MRIFKAEGRACLKAAEDIAKGKETLAPGAIDGLLAIGWCYGESETRFDRAAAEAPSFGNLDQHQIIMALCFAAAVAGVRT